MNQVRRVVTNMSASLPAASATELNKSLANADSLTRQILNPLMSSINDSIEAIILTMHQEAFNKLVMFFLLKLLIFWRNTEYSIKLKFKLTFVQIYLFFKLLNEPSHISVNTDV